MANTFPVSHSILRTSSLMTEVQRNYGIGTPTECQLLNRGLNDTYVIITENGKFVLRVYRKGWRSDSEIRFELDALLHLGDEGAPVSTPVVRKDGGTVGMVAAPEGSRHVVIFPYAPGKEPTYEGELAKESYLYGKVAAQIHAATDSFRSTHRRFSLDAEHLLLPMLKAARTGRGNPAQRPSLDEFPQLQPSLRDRPEVQLAGVLAL